MKKKMKAVIINGMKGNGMKVKAVIRNAINGNGMKANAVIRNVMKGNRKKVNAVIINTLKGKISQCTSSSSCAMKPRRMYLASAPRLKRYLQKILNAIKTRVCIQRTISNRHQVLALSESCNMKDINEIEYKRHTAMQRITRMQ